MADSPIVGQIVDSVRLKGAEDVFLNGAFAYIPCRQGQRLTICRISDPSKPEIVSSFTHGELGVAAGFSINGNIVYLTSMTTNKLLVIDVSDKLRPRLLGSVSIGGKGGLYKVAYREGYCYIPNVTLRKLFVVDVRKPEKPMVTGSVSVTEGDDGPFSVLLYSDYAYVGTIRGKQNRLAVVNIRNPAEPKLETALTGQDIGHLSGQVVDQRFYSVNWDRNAFLVFDLKVPGRPKLLSKLVDNRLGAPNRCIVAGNRAYLPMVEGNGVAVVDISIPENPQYFKIFRDHVLLKKTYGVAVRDHLLFVASREGNSLVVLDREELEKQ